MGSLSRPHFAIFPFMSQGHIIPLLHFSRLLLRRSAAVTIFTTPGNSQPIRSNLQDVDVSIIELPFPQNIEGVPPGVENTHQLPSMSCFVPFAKSTKLMQNSFEQSLKALHPPVSCIISDAFLGWTLESAQKFSVPRLVFFGVSNFSNVMYQILARERPHAETKSLEEEFSIPGFPHLKLTRNDFDPSFNAIEPSGPYVDFMAENIIAMAMSQGQIANSFYELESSYVDYWNEKIGPKTYCVGPFCTAMEVEVKVNVSLLSSEKPDYLKWLDEKLEQKEPVLYIAFGTQAEVSEEQLREIAEGLEKSNVSFMWILKSKNNEYLQEFENRVKNRGIVVSEWVDQLQILNHDSVTGFLSHCGWNSVLESISAGVPIIALPFMAEQHINARFVAEEIKTGLRIMPHDGSYRGFVTSEEVEKKVREMMCGGEKAVELRRKAAEYATTAREAVKEGGSSVRALDLMIDDVYGKTWSNSCLGNGNTLQNWQNGQDFGVDTI